MAVLGIDDTDSRDRGMCTTYLAALVADAIAAAGGSVERSVLIRLNPAIEHKTRGNAALAVHADCDPDRAFGIARDLMDRLAETDDPNTQPGLVVAPHGGGDAPEAIAGFARRAVRDRHALSDALELAAGAGYRTAGWSGGRGRIGALAAVGGWRAFDEWTYEHIAYRERDRWGTERRVDPDTVFAAANVEYPLAWDTVDRGTGDPVCVPNAPGPILYGIRGDDPRAVRNVAAGIQGERIERSALFLTNQGTDAHLRDVDPETIDDGGAYRITGRVSTPPETRRGGHVFFGIEIDESDAILPCAAFEPTKRFRDRVRALRGGDRLTVCGEVADGTVKLEKFAVRDLNTTERRTPSCPDCGRSMESAGRGQGYRCRDCRTAADGKVPVDVERAIEPGWYEVPPAARRHIAKPLVRGGFDARTHPER